jgi:hypothetical protein
MGIGPECAKKYADFLQATMPDYHNESGDVLRAMFERQSMLDTSKCPYCGYAGLDSISWSKAICRKCKEHIDI